MNAILALVWCTIAVYYAFTDNLPYAFGYLVISLLAEICFKLDQAKK